MKFHGYLKQFTLLPVKDPTRAPVMTKTADQRVSLLRRRFLNREDRLAFAPPWSAACPVDANGALEAMLRAHVEGASAPEVSVTWRTTEGKTGPAHGRFRLGTYSPAIDGTTRFACVDCDGGGHHSHPLADPLGTALRIQEACVGLGLASHLERSGGGKGWHVWLFFAKPVPAMKARRLLLTLAPRDAALVKGGTADAAKNKGLEVFPKQGQIRNDGLGNQVWLPWWFGATDGGNEFYRVEGDGELRPYLPDDFETVAETDIDRTMAAFVSGAKPDPYHARRKPNVKDSRPPIETIVRKYLSQPTGGRNQTGFDLACQIRDNGYSKEDARAALLEYQRTVENKGDHTYRVNEAAASLDQVYSAPAREPWTHREPESIEPDTIRPEGLPAANEDCPASAPIGEGEAFLAGEIVDEGGDLCAGAQKEEVHFTDLGNAKRVVKEYGHVLKYCFPWKQFLIHTGPRWQQDTTGAAVRCVKNTQAAFYRWIADKIKQLSEGQRQEDQEDGERKMQTRKLKEVLNHALKWEGAKQIKDCLDLVKSEKKIPILPHHLDANAFLLNLRNGTYDLKAGRLREHRREDFITKLAPVDFVANATCPLWNKCLDRWMDGNGDLINYLQRVVGYCLSGDVSEQCLWFFHGGGANGKSTFLLVLLHLLGDYGWQAVSDLLIQKRSDAHPTERADLFGKRFVATIETEHGKHIAEALMKQLTGGDKITARWLFKDFFSFDATHKIFLAANHKPQVRGTDLGSWRRIKLVPWTVTITDEEKDKHLVEKLKAESPGILNWALAGFESWQRHGLAEPDEVRIATDTYRAEQDTLAQFIDECCFAHQEIRVRHTAFFDAYKTWSGDKVLTPPMFRTMMQGKGYESKKGHGNAAFWLGIGLQNAEINGQSE